MNNATKEGLGFGITSGIITTLGLITGLSAGTHLPLAVIGGILTIAISDSISDAFGMRISKESNNSSSKKELWDITLTTFFAKFFVALSFIIPVLFFSLNVAVLLDIIWGLVLVVFFSYHLAKLKRVSVKKSIISHVGIFALVILVTHAAGRLIALYFV